MSITYYDETGAQTDRTIWPISLTFCATVRLLAAWCELRGGYRTSHLSSTARSDIQGAEPC